jgi:hypothetical protein
VPRGLKSEAAAAAIAIRTWGIVVTADLPRRYSATMKIPKTTGPKP